MENELKGQFIPVESKVNGELKKSSRIISKNSYEMLESYVKNKVEEMAKKVGDGEIIARPTGQENALPCKYCDYWSVCGNYLTNEANIIKTSDAEILKNIINLNSNQVGENNE